MPPGVSLDDTKTNAWQVKQLYDCEPFAELDNDMEYEYCPWCGVKTRKSIGATHKYLESSVGCWALYGELLAREYENYEYMSVHGLTVDAYALQHPGKESPQTINSVYVHLASLYSYFELGKPVGELSNIKKDVLQYKNDFVWLEPPADLKLITVADILKAETAAQHCANVEKWAMYIFEKWEAHHGKAMEVLKKTYGQEFQ